MAVSLGAELCGAKLRNPTVLASGIVGVTGALLVRVAKEGGAGAVTSKSCSLEPRLGHPNPIILDFPEGMINAVGLSNPGADDEVDEIKEAVANAGVPVIASIFADTAAKFGMVAEKISKANPSMIEVNISCPNVESEFGKPFASDPKAAAQATEAVKNVTKIPVIVKLSPNVANIKQIAQAVVEAGADAICAINTVGPGMIIDIESARPVLSNKTGGVSGPAIKPVAVRCIYDVFQAVKVPIIGTGGVSNGRDAIELMMAGASAVGIGTAVYSRGMKVFGEVAKEMEEWLGANGYSSAKEIVGAAQK